LSDDDRNLSERLSKLRCLIESNPSPIIGKKVTVQSNGNGAVIGSYISVTTGPGHAGPVIGEYISVTSGGGSQDQDLSFMSQLASFSKELHENGNSSHLSARLKRLLCEIAGFCRPVVAFYADEIIRQFLRLQ
jgi:hypothetical protein